MSPKFFVLALTATLFAGIVAQADESGSRYRRRPQVQQPAQQQPDGDYGGGYGGGYAEGGWAAGGVVAGGVIAGGVVGVNPCCAPPMPPPPIVDCCATRPVYPVYPIQPLPVPVAPPIAMPYGGVGYGGGCAIVRNNVGWTVMFNGQMVASGRAWQAGQLNRWYAQGCR